MRYFLDQADLQYRALRAAATAAGPGAPVPTCPGWDVRDLVRHLASVHSWALAALRTPPDGERPPAPAPPDGWDDVLAWWDARFAELHGALTAATPDTPAWTFVGPRTAAFWARRQAHEIAIHRLDAEHARPDTAVPDPLYDPEFAADGVDEFLTRLVVRATQRKPVTRAGRLRWHATDVDRVWELHVTPGEAPRVVPAANGADVTVTGTADALYRAAWGRPSGVDVAGDRSLLDALPRP
ncbi:maleylpyruvate isomerase family mycothiol-dependent enzyme [Saccharothrix obliqua]|uniref:maleylpyruvate isomerase family mycothiol-dependent enzyme n=1 Tax=Saccharothrix obliqua TaxID=2861747 RepID=UPI001C5F6590|nr:maleylpyruvate isomerase family mycothiol-dependent enzyme [Saccharothrix obliqua]MBW4715812.1 maleylpyruvate isomerase family mycothiol-dependent enzyme [Saccharothrix obliqua]